MKKINLLFFLIPLMIQSQSFQWIDNPAITYSLNPDLTNYTVITDDLSNVYLAGYKDTPFNSGGIYGSIFYRKYNSAGGLLFSKVFTGKVDIINMISVNDNNIIVSDHF